MAKKRAKTEHITDDLTISWNEQQTSFKNGKGGSILFKLPITMEGAWSDRRVARAINMAYVKGFEAASATLSQKAKTWTIKENGGVVKVDAPVAEKKAKKNGTRKR